MRDNEPTWRNQPLKDVFPTFRRTWDVEMRSQPGCISLFLLFDLSNLNLFRDCAIGLRLARPQPAGIEGPLFALNHPEH